MFFKNTHPGIITEEDQAKIIDILVNNRTGRRYNENNDIFRRRIICYQCNMIMSMNAKSFNDYKTVNYTYVCDNCHTNGRGHISVSERLIEKALMKYMNELMVEGFPTDEKSDEGKLITKLNSKLKRIEKERDKIQRAWIKDMMSEDDLTIYKKELDEEEYAITEELLKIKSSKPLPTGRLKELKLYFTTIFSEFTQDEKRSFVQQHIKGINFSRELIEGYQKRYDINVSNVDFF